MNRIFRPRGFFTVPDGTDVSPFLNATDIMQEDVPWGSLGEMSVAAGQIAPKSSSWIHVHPVVTQITYVVVGQLTVLMRDAVSPHPYTCRLNAGEAVLTPRHTLFQLVNESDSRTDVLYMASPSYVFEMEGGQVVYDDAVMVAEDWPQVAAREPAVAQLRRETGDIEAKRKQSLTRLSMRKSGQMPNYWFRQMKSMPEGSSKPDEVVFEILDPSDNLGFGLAVADIRQSEPHYHRHTVETYTLVSGVLEVSIGGKTETLSNRGESIVIPIETPHSARSLSDPPARISVFSSPAWTPEDHLFHPSGESVAQLAKKGEAM